MKGDERHDRRHVSKKPLACSLGRLPLCLLKSINILSFFVVKGDERHDRRHVSKTPLACSLSRLPLCLLKSINILSFFVVKGDERHDRRHVRDIESLRPSTSLTTALGLLLESGASSLPVIDEVTLTTIRKNGN